MQVRIISKCRLVKSGVLQETQVDIHLMSQRLYDIFICDSNDLVPASEITEDMNLVTLSIPAQLKRTGMRKKC